MMEELSFLQHQVQSTPTEKGISMDFGWLKGLSSHRHQTPVIATRQDINWEQVARRMFFRWNQENFFRYMRGEYALDHLVTNNVEPADVERLVPRPACLT